MAGRIFIKCDDAQVLSTRDQYRDLNPKEKFRLKLHKTHCPGCRSFHTNNATFSRNLNKLKWVRLTDKEKLRIKKLLEKHMSR
ncbi:hypothetical protein [Nonlabens ponticola]|uniref:Zf-HC2 domain-containing protein n=1 Tax=Nonlabens ponticola TaxID=2496866 RepID=A0A3S9MXS8_9FLAO|nr:hypothetical protein [Nonlabens ponticola]AZQ44065.1 hypothetical protein EJ995_07405 [Nonlabens ponticola]